MNELISAVLLLAVVVVVSGAFFLRHKKQKQFARELIRAAGGEYLNWSKAERTLKQGTYQVASERSSRYAVQEEAGNYAVGVSSKNRSMVNKINEDFVEKRLCQSKDLFDQLGLTTAQRLAVVRDEDANLINAGAGSGKTRTILAKVEYIIERGLAKPEQVLIVVYNRQTAQEIRKKVKAVAPSVTVETFHSLGLKIIKAVAGGNISISNLAEDDRNLGIFLSRKMRELLKIPSMLGRLISFFSNHIFEKNPEHGLQTKDEYFRRVRYIGLRSLNGTLHKSHQEVQIANWLTLNGIKWEYEQRYPHSEDRAKQHKPDFYLPDYDIWIEHFGINEDGTTAPWIPAHEYTEQMEWKRNEHRKHGTTLVETYSYESRKEGGIPRALEEKLSQCGVQKRFVSDEEIDILVRESFKPTSNFIKLVMRFLALSRENKLNAKTLVQRIISARDSAFLAIFNLLRESYEKKLADSDEIDFTDMIVRSSKHVEAGEYRSRYKYILVDEYQDITSVRLELLLAMQKQAPDVRLFCVGDDWQSIYQFQGSNVSLITDFERHFGAAQRTDLDQTFRYSQKISDFSSIFITQNPEQLNKRIVSSIASKAEAKPVRIIYHEEEKQQQELEKIVDIIALQSQGNNQTCFVLARYNHSEPGNWQEIKNYAKAKNVYLKFSTIHKAKGRESDWVVVLDNKSDLSGYSFPSDIEDDPVIRMVRGRDESFPNAEERRLFYVAITRTRRGVFLLSPAGKASEFIKEISPQKKRKAKHNAGQLYDSFVHIEKNTSSTALFCPECMGQTIQKMPRKDGGFFYGCSHFPLCEGKLPICPNDDCDAAVDLSEPHQADTHTCECGYMSKICPKCRKGILLPREGRYGNFLGCSQYFGVANCDYTKNTP